MQKFKKLKNVYFSKQPNHISCFIINYIVFELQLEQKISIYWNYPKGK